MYLSGMINAMGGGIGNAGAVGGVDVANLFKERMQQGGVVQDPRLAGISFDINESAKNRKMRGMRKLGESGVGGEKDAALEKLKNMGGPQLPLVMTNPMMQMGNVAGMYGANV
tara:strand:+ start:61 stop:399 length:339 start_codon:yes stop_codon:yes gene_type:complete